MHPAFDRHTRLRPMKSSAKSASSSPPDPVLHQMWFDCQAWETKGFPQSIHALDDTSQPLSAQFVLGMLEQLRDLHARLLLQSISGNTRDTSNHVPLFHMKPLNATTAAVFDTVLLDACARKLVLLQHLYRFLSTKQRLNANTKASL